MNKVDKPFTIQPSRYLYLVDRTSGLSTEPPCEEAFLATKARTEILWKANEEHWNEIGINHRVEDGVTIRDNGFEQVWVIKIASLHCLQKFIDKYGRCIVEKHRGFNTIEIYDAYRE